MYHTKDIGFPETKIGKGKKFPKLVIDDLGEKSKIGLSFWYLTRGEILYEVLVALDPCPVSVRGCGESMGYTVFRPNPRHFGLSDTLGFWLPCPLFVSRLFRVSPFFSSDWEGVMNSYMNLHEQTRSIEEIDGKRKKRNVNDCMRVFLRDPRYQR